MADLPVEEAELRQRTVGSAELVPVCADMISVSIPLKGVSGKTSRIGTITSYKVHRRQH